MMIAKELGRLAETLVNKPNWTLDDRDAVIVALRQAEKRLMQTNALVRDWRERARLARPLNQDEPISAERRARIKEWMFYNNRASELESTLRD